MDAKITLSFDENIIDKAKDYAESKGISLSRLTEISIAQSHLRRLAAKLKTYLYQIG
jgi:uncharacterized protein YggE